MQFKHTTITFILLYSSMFTPHLDYCCSVWSPHSIGKCWNLL